METDRFLPGEPLYRLSGDVDPKDGGTRPPAKAGEPGSRKTGAVIVLPLCVLWHQRPRQALG